MNNTRNFFHRLLPSLAALLLIPAISLQAATVNVSVRVAPEQTVVIDGFGTITQIINPDTDPGPTDNIVVRRRDREGPVTEMTSSLQQQYDRLSELHGLDGTGAVYERNDPIWVRLGRPMLKLFINIFDLRHNIVLIYTAW